MIKNITFLVKDYDEAIQFFIEKLNFELVEDTPLTESKRWVRVMPPQTLLSTATCLLLAKAEGSTQIEAIGKQTGGRVFLFLETNNFEQSYRDYKNNGIRFTEEPRHEDYGSVVVFADLYGNLWDLIETR